MACNFNCSQGRRCVCDTFHDPDFDAEDFLRQEGALHAAIRALFVLVGIAGLCGALLFWLGAVGVI